LALFPLLAGPIRPGTAPRRRSIRADASAGVATARFTLQLTLGLVPKLRLMAFRSAVLLPKLVSALSYLVLSLIGMLFHITVLPMFHSRRIRCASWLIDVFHNVLTEIIIKFIDVFYFKIVHNTST
jgi:hypothetical protein